MGAVVAEGSAVSRFITVTSSKGFTGHPLIPQNRLGVKEYLLKSKGRIPEKRHTSFWIKVGSVLGAGHIINNTKQPVHRLRDPSAQL